MGVSFVMGVTYSFYLNYFSFQHEKADDALNGKRQKKSVLLYGTIICIFEI